MQGTEARLFGMPSSQKTGKQNVKIKDVGVVIAMGVAFILQAARLEQIERQKNKLIAEGKWPR